MQTYVIQREGLVENAEQEARHGGCRLFDFVEKHQREIAFFAGDGIELLLGEHRLGFPVSQVPRRCANELGHFMLHLEFAAVHLQDVFLAAVQHFRQRFYSFGFARSR